MGTQIQAQVGRAPDPEELDKWYAEHGLEPDKDGVFTSMPYGKPPVDRSVILQQVEINAKRRDVPNLPPREYTPKIMVYVAGGPSLRDYLDDIKAKCESEHYDVVTSNMTAKFLLAKGITPNYHLILDPTEKKKKDIDYEEDIELYLGLQCHPALFELAKERGKRVHKFLAASVKGDDGKSDKDFAQQACHADDPQMMGIGGGSMCGTRMIYFAGLRGYRKLEYYGFDGSVEYKNNVIKCYAYTKPRGENIIETQAVINGEPVGKKFYSTMSLARQGEELIKLMDVLPGMNIEIFGDGLLAETLRLYQQTRPRADYRISPKYLEMQKEMHARIDRVYGVAGSNNSARVFMAGAQMLRRKGVCDVLDYGCGPGLLVNSIRGAFPDIPGLNYYEYDPCIPGKDAEPKPADVVFCGDVMEHVESECVEAVVRHIRDLTKSVAIFIISLRPASKTLPDGRNAHITVKPQDWWLSWIKKYFIVVEEHVDPHRKEVVAVCTKLP